MSFLLIVGIQRFIMLLRAVFLHCEHKYLLECAEETPFSQSVVQHLKALN